MCILAPDRSKCALPHKEIHIRSQLKLLICVEPCQAENGIKSSIQWNWIWNDVCLKSYCLFICVCYCVYTCTWECESCSTHLVWKESFDLGSNGIKIPTDKVGEEAGCKDRKRGWVTEGESYDSKTDRGREAEIEKRRGERTSGHVSALWYMQRRRGVTPPRGKDGETWGVTGWISEALTEPLLCHKVNCRGVKTYMHKIQKHLRCTRLIHPKTDRKSVV